MTSSPHGTCALPDHETAPLCTGASEIRAPRLTAFCAREILVAIDGGGTKTEAVAFLPDGNILSHAIGGASNPNDAGHRMDDIIVQTWRRLGLEQKAGTISAVCAGIAGGSHGAVQAKVGNVLKKLAPRARNLVVTHDAVTALWSGIETPPGIVLLVGTGSVAFGIDKDSQEFRFGGWGHLVGDDGSGYDIGKRALQAILTAHDRAGKKEPIQDILTTRILSKWGASSPSELIPQIYRNGKHYIASLVPEVLAAARAGHAASQRIINDAVDCLVQLLAEVLSRHKAVMNAEMAALPVPVVQAGGLWNSPEVRAAFRECLKERSMEHEVSLILPDLPPVFGAARYLARMAGVPLPKSFEINFRKNWPSDMTPRTPLVPLDSRSQQSVSLDTLATEEGNNAWEDLDTLDPSALASALIDANDEAVAAVRREMPGIARIVDIIAACFVDGGRLFYAGAGTSGRLGILDASECPPTFGVSNEMVQGHIAGGKRAIIEPVEGAEDDELQGEQDARLWNLRPSDIVIAISASGRTPWCIGVLKESRRARATTVAFSCNKNAAMSAFADEIIELATGAEVLAGSTRLKAGTAQKIVLNILSTATMVQLGKIYKNKMVDMATSNEKLRHRARRIIMQTAGVASEQQAEDYLKQADGNIKAAIVMAITGVSARSAASLLAKSKGFVRKAISA